MKRFTITTLCMALAMSFGQVLAGASFVQESATDVLATSIQIPEPSATALFFLGLVMYFRYKRP